MQYCLPPFSRLPRVTRRVVYVKLLFTYFNITTNWIDPLQEVYRQLQAQLRLINQPVCSHST